MRTTLLALIFAALGVLAAAPAAAQEPCRGSYTIRPGDNLQDIATRCATTIPAILAVNPALRAGGELQPGGVVRVPPPEQAAPTPVQACGGFYTLRPGDALGDVATRCGVTVPLLMAANPALQDPQNVRPGGRIRIPDLPPPGAFEPVIVPDRGSVTITGPRGEGAAAAADTAAADTAAADTAAADTASDAAADAEPAPYVRYEGVLRSGGACTVLRTPDGAEVGIVGGLGPGFAAGDRVVVTGPAVADSDCGTERAVRVRIMWRPRS